MKQFLFFSLLFLTTITNAQTNLIKNGGFESELINWRGEEIASISPYDKKFGQKSALINQFVGAEWKALDQIVSLPKNTYAVEFSVWIKTESIEDQKEAYKAGAMIAEFTDGSEKKITSENIAQVKGTTAWTNYKKTIKVPADAKKIRIMLALAQTNGSIYFDDVKAITISEEEYLKQNPIAVSTESPKSDSGLKTFSNGNFENNLSSWNGSGLISTTDKKEGNAASEITSKTAEWKSIDQIADINANDKTIEISGWLKAKDIQQGKDSWNNGMLIIEFKKDNNQKASEDQVIAAVTGTTDWTSFQKSFTIPQGALQYRIMIALSNCTGTLLADNIEVKLSK
ncbi:carbohydrate binding protein [Flavobacterium sp. 90]|uniref:carbohydrate binding domain-containing protein n=1 Tax=unclassified Flavobacterium TaxID=196869 RepID=UPI000F1637D4|nr:MULTISPECIES: carbohydrate binding domain-containing protein [unclassified Flavobacterium]RKR11416.1 carbohydrate binding protein [Flavobacterium sp. 81]TCK55197.1 carbohydrate binding protein [Flavobacterium sp. 90]